MTLKDFKVVIYSKIKFADRHVKEKDYYLGYISCMEDILVFINGDKEERLENNT